MMHCSARHVFRGVPLRLVYGYEHVWYEKNGYKCTPRAWEQNLAELLQEI